MGDLLMRRLVLPNLILAIVGPLILALIGALHSSANEPKITVEQQATWLQARAELAEAKLAVTAAEAKLAGIVASMQNTCPLILKDGRPECAPIKAEPAEKK